MSLDLSSLNNAIAQLAEALDLYGSEIVRDNPKLKKPMRAATIKAFGFTYVISVKMLRRHMTLASDNPAEIRQMSFSNFIREAYGKNLVRSDIVTWRKYRGHLDMIDRAYDENTAQEIFEVAPDFLDEARYVLDRLQERLDSPIAINPDHLKIVWRILRENLPSGVTVWVIGSRANWTSKDSSDLDLALEGNSALDHGAIVALKTAFEKSSLPYEVDIMDINQIANSFRRIVEAQRAPLPDER